MFAVLSLYFNVTSHTLHAAPFLSIISRLFQLNDAEMLPYGGFPVHILTISNASSILKIYPSDQTATYKQLAAAVSSTKK